MSKTEYFAMFESLLYGLALAHILVVCSRMIAHRKTIKFHWAHILLIFTLLCILSQRYYKGYESTQEYQHVSSAWEFLLLLILPLGLFFVLSYQMFPEKIEGANLKEFLYEKSQEIISIFISFAVIVAIRNIVTDRYSMADGLLESEGYYQSERFLTFFVTIVALALLGGAALFTKKRWLFNLIILLSFCFNLYLLIIT